MAEKLTTIPPSEPPTSEFHAFTAIDIPDRSMLWDRVHLPSPNGDFATSMQEISRIEQDELPKTSTNMKIVDLCSGNLVGTDEHFDRQIQIGDNSPGKDVSTLRSIDNLNIPSFIQRQPHNDASCNGFTLGTSRGYDFSVPHSEGEDDYQINTPRDFQDTVSGWSENEYSLTSHVPNKVMEQATVVVFMLITQPRECSLEEWQRLNTNLIITHSETTSQVAYPISQNTDICYQEVIEMPNATGGLVRELSIYLNTRAHIDDSTENLFQIFLAVTNGSETNFLTNPSWNQLEVVSFIQNLPTCQVIRPINQKITFQQISTNPLGVFHASFTMHDDKLNHFLPTEASLIQQAEESKVNNEDVNQPCISEQVVLVGRNDIIQEVNGARGGRPLHKLSGQLLMTRQQVEKVLEIRNRWQGLSPRQRRDNVTNADFYTFLTLNRDETADCLGVCATWLKDAIRSQGVHVWPGRPLRRTGALLQSLKESLASVRAAMRYTDPNMGQLREYQSEIQRLQNEIRDVLNVRMDIVKQNVSSKYFEKFVAENGKQYLDPEWEALPPSISPRKNS